VAGLQECADEQRRTAMKKVQGQAVSNIKVWLATLGISLIVAGIAQAQADLPIVMGKFTLSTPVWWNATVLQPGDYTITIGSGSLPTFALVRDSKGRPVARLMSRVDSGKTGTVNELLIGEKDGQLRVYSLALASLGRVMVYDPALAHQAAMEARAPRTVPVMLSKR
jgi:hypothetical protein